MGVNDVCLGVIHKVPAPGGMSAVGGTGSEYFFYDNGVISEEKLGACEFTAYVQNEASADGNFHRCATDDGPKKVEEGTHTKKTINIDLEALRKKFVEQDCPVMMKTLELPDEPIPLWWTADMINASLGKCWENVPVADQKRVVGEFNCSCVGISKCLPAYCKSDTPNVSWKDIPAEEAGHATKYGDIVGAEAAKMLGVAACADEAPKAEEAPKNEAPKAEEAPAEAAKAAPEQEEDELDKKLKPAFADIDKNSSGFIEAKELKAVLAQMGVEMDDEAVAGVLKIADVNQDNKLDYAEYKALVSKAMK